MILFQNAKIFDGNKIISSDSVLVENNIIREIGKNIKANKIELKINVNKNFLMPGLIDCLLYTSPSPRDVEESRMPSSA